MRLGCRCRFWRVDKLGVVRQSLGVHCVDGSDCSSNCFLLRSLGRLSVGEDCSMVLVAFLTDEGSEGVEQMLAKGKESLMPHAP
jgi:hypothetical protein